MQMVCGEKMLFYKKNDLLGKFLTLRSDLGMIIKKSLFKAKYFKKNLK